MNFEQERAFYINAYSHGMIDADQFNQGVLEIARALDRENRRHGVRLARLKNRKQL